MAAAEKNQPPSIDPETLSQVAREVIARLGRESSRPTASEPLSKQRVLDQHRTPHAGSKTSRTAASIDDRVITMGTLSRLPAATAELFVPANAVITPSARDEVRARRISINRGVRPTSHEVPANESLKIIDFADPGRAAVVAQQLARRAIVACGAKIILSETPARDVYHQCVRQGEVAVMVGSVDEVQRFASELEVTVWVLDMKRLNLTAAVNVAAQISRTGKHHR